MSSPELSIILPVYNVDPWLCECLDSIQAQTFTNWEAILVDDGSTDFSGIFCDSYARSDSRFRVIHQKNAGVSAARNTGIEAANGGLLSFIDPDDHINHNYFESLLSELRRINADVAQASILVIDESGKKVPNFWGPLESRACLPYREMIGNNSVVDGVTKNIFSCVSWGRVFRRELWGAARFSVGTDLGEDMEIIPAVIIKANRAVYVDDSTYYYRRRRKSLLNGTVTQERLWKDFDASGEMLKKLTAHSPDHAKEFQRLKLQYDIGAFFSYLNSKPQRISDAKESILFRLVPTLNKFLSSYGRDSND